MRVMPPTDDHGNNMTNSRYYEQLYHSCKAENEQLRLELAEREQVEQNSYIE